MKNYCTAIKHLSVYLKNIEIIRITTLTNPLSNGNMRALLRRSLDYPLIKQFRGIAQSGSAPALGAGCREFESLYPDHFFQGVFGFIVPCAHSSAG